MLLEDQNDVNAAVQQEVEQLKEQITQGQKAREVLDNEEFKRWFAESQAALFDVLDDIPLNDKDARQRAVDLIYLFRKFDKTFKESVEIGEASQKRWQEIVNPDKKGLLARVFNV